MILEGMELVSQVTHKYFCIYWYYLWGFHVCVHLFLSFFSLSLLPILGVFWFCLLICFVICIVLLFWTYLGVCLNYFY